MLPGPTIKPTQGTPGPPASLILSTLLSVPSRKAIGFDTCNSAGLGPPFQLHFTKSHHPDCALGFYTHAASRATIMALPIPSAVTATSTSCSHLPLQPQAQRQRQRGAADTFALAVTRQAVAQAALAVGCKHTYPSVLDALTDMVRDFIIALGTEAQTKAESGGRTRVTLLDVLAALDEPQQETGRDRYELDWRALRGFAFRGDLTQLDQPEAFQWYQPFHTHIPPFPVCSGSSGSGIAPSDGLERALPVEGGGEVMCSSGAENGAGAAASGEEGRMWPPYVPSFLPAFPPQHTFRKTSLKASSKMEDPVAIQRHRIATKQLILKAIARQKTTSGKSTTCSGIVERDEAKKTEVLGSLSSSVSSSHAVPKRATCDRPLPNKDEEADEDLLFSSDAQDSRPVATALEVFTAESK